MISTNNNSVSIQTPLAQFANKAKSLIQFYAYDSPLLNQWCQLISTIRENANTRQWVTLINPPFIPNDQYLKEIGLQNHYLRIVRLDSQCPQTTNYIQKCLQNGKSTVVAVWASNVRELPEILLNDAPLSCQALVFTDSGNQQPFGQQMEMAF